MVNRQLLRLARGTEPRIVLHVVVGLLVTATYAGQSLAVAGVLDRIFAGRPFGSTIGLLAAVVALQVVRSGLVWWREVLSMAIGGAVRRTLRTRLYSHLIDLGPGYTAQARTGSVLTAMVDNVESVDSYYGRFLPQVAATGIGAVVLIGYIFSLDTYVGAVVAICAVIVPVAPQVSRRFYRRASIGWNEKYRSLYANSLDAIQGMTTLKAFNAHGRRGEQIAAESEDFNRASVRLMATSSVSSGVAGLATSAGTALSIGVGALRLADGALGVSELLVILLMTRECFRPLTDLERSYHSAYSAPAAAEGIFGLLDAAPSVDPRPDAEGSRISSTSVTFDEVTFSYRADRSRALDAVSFHVDVGETVAIVGRSGAGKTTAASLLMRFFDPESGSIRIGDRDVRDLSIDDLRAAIAVVAQDTYLFHGTIRHNLTLANVAITDDEMIAAARAARVHEFVTALPDGYDTVIGERGLKLSGGERQRVAIARAILKDAPILVLDEATSAIDGEGEAAIQGALELLTASRTTLVIAHRLSTVRSADRVVVLDGGCVVEYGPPDELLDQRGAYARLVTAQVGS